ncbi:MAG TPA: TonB-dependent receptor plug domain-containing protein, partial [Hyphomonadaceae bacterium]|nr:TonB-dependent receptor plug domain-containing protein [Hyphomonadaceae bacterium]
MFQRLSGAIGLAALLAGQAVAQGPAVPGELQVFEPGYFARYNPTTAQDMVNQVPGFSIQEGDAVRGFGGSAGNVLINGNRPSTKNSLTALLGRIPATSVIRIELVTGASSTLDMRGQTKVVNVIVREDALAEPITFDAMARYTADGRITGSLQASTQRSLFGGLLNISGNMSTHANNGPGGGSFVDGQRHRYDLITGLETEFGEGYTQQQPDVRQANFEYERDLSLFALRLNGSWSATDLNADRVWRSFSPNSTGALTLWETQATRNSTESATLGGDLERNFGDIDAKVITYHRRDWSENSIRFASYTPAGSLISASTSAPEPKSGESILRGQVNWRLSESHSVEIAAETAYNFLENITEFTSETPSGSTTFFLDGSDTKVEEFRNEFQISDVWTISPSLTLEPGFKFETSRIEQDISYATRPDLHAEREFEYPKPSITATWGIRQGQQLRLSYEREVAQLSFTDFVSAADFIANQNTGGNAELVPERTWAFNAEFEQRFGRGGVVTLFGSYDEVEDVQDFVVILIDHDSNPATPNVPVDAPGNIGDGTRWALGVRATVPLEIIGLAGARLDTSLSGGGSEVTDPVTGETREFSDEFKESWFISFRHDFPAQKFSYGFRYADGGPATAYRFNETSRRSREDADISAWIETTAFFGLRIRAGVDDMFPAEYAR